MSKLFRSILVVATLVGSAQSAFAGGYHGYGYSHQQYSKKYYGKKHHNTLAFFDWLRRNGN
jgi:hypothetical protein